MELKLTKKQESVKLILEKNFVPINIILIVLPEYYRSSLIIKMLSDLFTHGLCYPIICDRMTHFITSDKTNEIKTILEKAGIKYECGNNAPRGGKSGNYFKINFWGKKACIAIQRDFLLEMLFNEWEAEK